ncbi:hypothetical protein BWQ96_06785 [Gracilariopsis chorda]|uniref:Uncharacterized protein n=1 Tax=Gracilariopsis chorda TaxID=448386 RepID=A0A2V3IN42_9FLOR|nr:hypothetical protein BWQ96_06785 [Gracilariopsis chorda]|eukprot:PXF43492.1 hypothetical protein BWQ96_06785 [Gracilariopsis chorda]
MADNHHLLDRRLHLWRRVMHTRALQWRFLNTVALQQLAVQESRACHQLARLHQTLSNLQHAYVSLLQKASKALSNSAASASAPALHNLAGAVHRLQYDRLRADVACSTRHALLVGRRASDFSLVLNAFLHVATRFLRLATRLRLRSFAQLRVVMHTLAACAAKQPCVITDAAHSVHRAATLSERHRSHLLIHHHQQSPTDCSSPATVATNGTH